jgi:hypothetical protein
MGRHLPSTPLTGLAMNRIGVPARAPLSLARPEARLISSSVLIRPRSVVAFATETGGPRRPGRGRGTSWPLAGSGCVLRQVCSACC